MSRIVLAMGLALVTAAGCVWYLPALADLRAGSDRPHARRTAAGACLTGWATAAATAVVLLLAQAWWASAGAATAGAAATAALRIRAAVQHRYEAREAARHWAALHHTLPSVHRGGRRAQYAFAAVVGAGLVTALATATLLLAVGPEDGGDWLAAAAVPVAVVGLSLLFALMATHLRMTRGRMPTHPTRPPR
jgi:hypothetical protein